MTLECQTDASEINIHYLWLHNVAELACTESDCTNEVLVSDQGEVIRH